MREKKNPYEKTEEVFLEVWGRPGARLPDVEERSRKASRWSRLKFLRRERTTEISILADELRKKRDRRNRRKSPTGGTGKTSILGPIQINLPREYEKRKKKEKGEI